MIATGGTWDPTDRPIYFIAGPDHDVLDAAVAGHSYVLVALNELPIGDPVGKLNRILDTGANVLLDSGIFEQAMRHKRAHGLDLYTTLALPPEQLDGWDRLWPRYLKVVKACQDRLWGYVELDQGGRDRKRATRSRLHAEGLAPMPVYHPLSDGLDYFTELAEGQDRMCAANLVQTPWRARRPLLATLTALRQAHPTTWVHLLGLTPDQFLYALDAGDSADSSTWSRALRYTEGYREIAAGQGFGLLPVDFKHRLGNRKGQPGYDPLHGRDKAVSMSAIGAAGRHRNWRNYTHRLQELGLS